jgi:hypothetical protein
MAAPSGLDSRVRLFEIVDLEVSADENALVVPGRFWVGDPSWAVKSIWRRHPAQELPFAERVRPIVLIDPLAIRLRRATGVAMGSIANSPIDGSIALAATHNTV